MYRHSALAASLLAAVALAGCGPDAATRPDPLTDLAASHSSGGGHLLVVDDGSDCRNPDFATIQGAVAAAEPGTTIQVCAGIYPEQVMVTKSDLRILAKGKPGEVILDGGHLHAMLAGFLLDNAHRNLIQGFVVKRYHEAQIWLRNGSSENTVRKNLTIESNFHDGIQLTSSPRNVVEHNVSSLNVSPHRVACGINVIGPGSSGNIVRHNETFGNDFGVQVAAGASGNVVFGNVSYDNRRNGIRNIGSANGTIIENNRVWNNGASLLLFNAGIAVVVGSDGVTVARNKAFDNLPVDLLWDGTGFNRFENNHCRTSVPPGLCEHTEGSSP